MDTRGRLISMGNATDLLDLNITNYDNGVYMIKIKHDQFENSYRVIKQ
ncbi:MAG: T9SS type A sorting domain-containing protein [Flavobacteriia bacterium]